MIELVITILIVGILAVAVVPRFFAVETFQSRGFYDEALSILRYAHKTAVAQRRNVYFNLDAANERIRLCYADDFPSCSTAANQVPGPYGDKPYTVTAASGVDLQITTATYFFDALGRPYLSYRHRAHLELQHAYHYDRGRRRYPDNHGGAGNGLCALDSQRASAA